MSTLLMFVVPERSARAEEGCAPARLVTSAERLAPAWQAALEALVAATSIPGQPWGCSGAQIRLQVGTDGHGELEITDAGGRIARRSVASPDDLVPEGEALLATPLAEPSGSGVRSVPSAAGAGDPGSPAPQAPPVLPAVPGAVRALLPAPEAEPRIHVDALLSARFAGPIESFWGGGVLRATLGFDAWSAGVWARFDAPAVFARAQKYGLSMTEVSIGLAVDRTIVKKPFELRVGFEPSLAVVSMVAGKEPNVYDGAKLDGRFGLALRAVFPVNRTWRLLAGVDGEIAPAAAGTVKSRLIDPELPPIPAFTLGLSLGAGMGFL